MLGGVLMKTIQNTNVIYSFKPNMMPVETVEPGEVFKVYTNDCFFQQITSEDMVLTSIDHSTLNPATGPIFINGAEPGDLLKIKILNIDIADKGVVMIATGEGVLAEKAKKSLVKIIPIKDRCCQINGLEIPINPMIGVIGVAPENEDGEWGTDSPWKHGGNMDTKDICEGTTIYFPVRQVGGLLALGDLHAIMGDGEICFTGLEVKGEVTLIVDVIKNKTVNWPILETSYATMVIASGDTLDDAIKAASDQAVEHLASGLEISWEEAYMLASLVVDIKISQVVDPKKTARAVIPKTILITDKLIRNI
jgi:amidase